MHKNDIFEELIGFLKLPNIPILVAQLALQITALLALDASGYEIDFRKETRKDRQAFKANGASRRLDLRLK